MWSEPCRGLALVSVLGVTLFCSGCFVVFASGSLERSAAAELSVPREVTSPLKAFYADGSTAVFPDGATITEDSIVGRGRLYSLGLVDTTAVQALSMDALVGIEAFQGETNDAATVLGSVVLTGLAVLGSVALFKAIFGSCPTFYTSTEDGEVLQAEAFSYSIAPLLEGRDLDAIDLRPDPDGVLRLELRNEALETHYINHLELVSVDHLPGTRVVSDDRGMPVGVLDEVTPLAAVDRSGRRVLEPLLSADREAFSSDEARIRHASGEDPDDWIELAFPRPRGDDAVLRLRLRNSLLTTVLFYDLMLGQAGVGALDWIGRDLARIGTVVEMGRWFQESMGLRVEVRDGDSWEEVGRVPDTGPIAWEEVGVRVPVGDTDLVRVRLRFLTDAWRIDRVSLGRPARPDGETRLPVARILDDGSSLGVEPLERLAAPDDDYLATYPGTSVMLEFDPEPQRPGLDRTYLLASQGYYTEWVRPEWIRATEAGRRFEPGDDTVEDLMGLWLDKKDAFETDFYSSKIPVR